MNPQTLESRESAALSERSARLLAESRARIAAKPQSLRRESFMHGFFDLYAEKPYWERYALSMAHAIESEPVVLTESGRLVGMLYQASEGHGIPFQKEDERWAPYASWNRATERIESEIEPYLRVWGAPGHVGWHWERILERGVEGLMREIRERLEGASDERAERLYRGALALWESVLRWNDRHVAALEERAERASASAERERLESLAALCRRVPRHPARNFHEALQAFHFQHLVLMFENPYGGNGPGRVDALLWPWLERDLADGTLTREEARELIDELLIGYEERLFPWDGWVEAVTVGGSHVDGSTDVNPLSHLIVESFMALSEQTHPSVYVRLSKSSPDAFVTLTARYLVEGRNRAQVYNDEATQAAMVAAGVAPRDAAHFMAGGCMEISPMGAHSDMNFTCIHSVAKTAELFLNGGVCLCGGERLLPLERTLADYDSFEAFYDAFEAEMVRQYAAMTRSLDITGEAYAEWRPCYLLSSLVDDCLERGLEQLEGGARYNDYGFSPLGITSAADSFTALKRAVFDEGFVEGRELLDALRANYEGYEPLRRRLSQIPRFGVEDAEADAMCARVLSTVCRAAKATKNRLGGTLKPMLFTFVWAPEISRGLGASPDGSRAGALIGHGATPRSCAMTRGLTAAMNSSTALDLSEVSGGATTMWDMDSEWIRPDLMESLLRGFLSKGGMIFQGNTTSVSELEAAIESPERYASLIVRVGGFSARFTTLERALQEEIVRRRRHSA